MGRRAKKITVTTVGTPPLEGAKLVARVLVDMMKKQRPGLLPTIPAEDVKDQVEAATSVKMRQREHPSLPDWIHANSVDELMDGLYPTAGVAVSARKLLEDRARRLLLSHEMKKVWAALEKQVVQTERQKDPLFRYFWVAMNVELYISLSPEPQNSDIKIRHARISNLATKLADEIRNFSNKVGLHPYDDAAKTLAAIARANPQQEPRDFELDCARVAHELQLRHFGFDNGQFLDALRVLAEGCLTTSEHRYSRNVITKAASATRTRNEIALVMIRAAGDYLGSPHDELVASTVNSILDLVEDGEAMTGDSVKKLRQKYQGKIFSKK